MFGGKQMDKKFWRSKTLWGFGIAGIIALGQTLGVGVSETLVAEIAKILTAFLGVYGLRSAVSEE